MTQPDSQRSRWHARSVSETADAARADVERGLSTVEAAQRLLRLGPNELASGRREPWWEEGLEALTEPLVLLLIAVAVLYAVLGELEDAVTIFFVILAVAGVEVANETRAKRAIAALRSLSAPSTVVVREGQALDLPTREVVRGDLALLQPGRRVPADLRLVEAFAVRIDESSLTGESAPVSKQADVVLPADTELGDRRNLAFGGTVVVAGKGRGVVVATGPETELGRIARLAQAAREPSTPLQLHLRELAGWLLWLALGFSVLIPVLGVFVAGQPPREMLLTGLTLAFATIPEELPILVTIVLGLGAYQLARRRAIARRLQAAETLGSVSVVGTDKTGTLTENRMRLVALFVDGAVQSWSPGRSLPRAARLIEIGILASDAQLGSADGEPSLVGDPTEQALLMAAEEAGVSVGRLRSEARIEDEIPFEDGRRYMAVAYERDGQRWLVAKGAPEVILGGCRGLAGRERREVQAAAERMAERGLRVLAFAERRLAPGEHLEPLGIGPGLAFVGLAGLEDPPRSEAPEAIDTLRRAGVRVVMLTGDHPATARAIAERVGIDASTIVLGRELERANDEELDKLTDTQPVFARITAEHKLRIVRALAARGEVVAVTGDGVNDAPALREAAIGVAMGRAGTDVAREAADLVLADDNLATVTVAVGEGRRLYANLRKAVRYYLAAKVGLVSASVAAVVAGLPVPFAPVQIIVLELFMDLGASGTFVAEPPEADLMALPPRDPKRRFMDNSMQLGILGGGLTLAAAVLVAYLWAWEQGLGAAAAQTAAFASWMVGHLVLAAHMRSERQPLLRTSPLANRPYLIWVGAALGLLAASTWPPLAARLHLVSLPAQGWAVAITAGLVLPSWWEVAKWALAARRVR